MSVEGGVLSVLRGWVLQANIANVPCSLLNWIAANPEQSVLVVINGVLFFYPSFLTGPLLVTMGFGATGPVAGSVAASLNSVFGNVASHGPFAYLQSAGMGGYGVAAVNGLVQAGGLCAGGVMAALSYLSTGGHNRPGMS